MFFASLKRIIDLCYLILVMLLSIQIAFQLELITEWID